LQITELTELDQPPSALIQRIGVCAMDQFAVRPPSSAVPTLPKTGIYAADLIPIAAMQEHSPEEQNTPCATPYANSRLPQCLAQIAKMTKKLRS
jgi:hypothetical protein